MKNNTYQKGFSIYLVMIIVAMLLSVSLNIGTVIINSAKMSGNLSDGIRAFHCADSGIEHALYHVTRTTPVCTGMGESDGGGIPLNDTAYKYTFTVNPNIDCANTGTTITSTGSYKSTTKRIIEVSY
ncbi:MAG: pilus assembly PilX N-terminal domain-containing protein [Candidatus Pacebacteria bacterium]|nr:pilus assembly PilX N-terminal domain-containing protein [Candidatus Paceibacterota bacterium]